MKRKFRIPERLIPKPSKIMKRGIYDLIGEKTKKRDYDKRIKKGKF